MRDRDEDGADLWIDSVDTRLCRVRERLASAREFTELALRQGVRLDLRRRFLIEQQLNELIDAADAIDASFMGAAAASLAEAIATTCEIEVR